MPLLLPRLKRSKLPKERLNRPVSSLYYRTLSPMIGAKVTQMTKMLWRLLIGRFLLTRSM